MYYLYKKSPKKCRELTEIITDLQDCLNFDDGGKKPVRASGTHWIAHKLSAMKRIISKYGAHTNHLAALSEDRSVNSCDRCKLRGYFKRWVDGEYLLGCAMFVDVFNPCAIYSKTM